MTTAQNSHRIEMQRFWLAVALFASSLICAYTVYPHWITFSQLALRPSTLPFFVIAMTTTMYLLIDTGRRLQGQAFVPAARLMYLSSVCIGTVILIPSQGGLLQVSAHNTVALFSVLSAATALALVAYKWLNTPLALSAFLQFSICTLELILLARYDSHPVQPWIWTILEVVVSIIQILSLYKIRLELTKSNQRK